MFSNEWWVTTCYQPNQKCTQIFNINKTISQEYHEHFLIKGRAFIQLDKNAIFWNEGAYAPNKTTKTAFDKIKECY